MTRPPGGVLAFGLALLALCAALAYPLRLAAAHQDDFVYLALARHLDSPWVLLAQDSVGSYFFRPLVMLFWWVSGAVLGESAAAHSFLGIALHGANGALLFALLRRHRIGRAVAAIVALAFVAHPAAFSTAAWLSARFDLFATGFALATLLALDRALERPSAGRYALVVAAALGAMFSKENGFAVAVLAALAALWVEPGRHAAGARARWTLAAWLAAATIAAFVARSLLLRAAPQEGLLPALLQALVTGTWGWAKSLPAFLVVPEGRMVSAIVLGGALLALSGTLAAPQVRTLLRPLLRLAALGVGLMLLAAAAQSPTVAHAPIARFGWDAFNPVGVVSARFYYLPLAGFALALAALAEAAARAPLPRFVHVALTLAAVAAILGMAATSRTIARQWAHFTVARSEVFLRPAAAAVSALVRLAPGCKVYLLELPPEAGLLKDMLDTAIKQSLPRGHPALACFLQSEHAPWYHLLARERLPKDAEKPLEIIDAGGRPYPPLVVGNLVYYYVRVAPGSDVAADPAATFLAFRDGRFVDVTAAVRARELRPRFHDRRAP